jgi:subtilisin family serine protease
VAIGRSYTWRMTRPSNRLRLALAAAIVAVGVTAAPARPAEGSSSAGRIDGPHTAIARKALPHGVRLPDVDELIVRFRRTATPADRVAAHETAGARVVARIPDRGLTLVRPRPGTDPLAAMRRYVADGAVRTVEPNLPRPLLETVPDDPFFGELWGLRNTGQVHSIADPPPATAAGAPDADIDAADAWDVTMGAATTVVAVLDTGADLSHPDLVPSLWQNPGETPGNGIDDDANGFVDDLMGWDFADDDANPQDVDGHGTHVAGTIAAAMNDGVGVAGVCPDCRIMVLRFDLDLFSELAAIDYAIANGASILNGSFGGAGFSLLERKAFQRAESAGVLSVIAAGNEGANQDMLLVSDGLVVAPLYPAAFDLPGIVSVAASNHLDEYGYATGCFLRTGDRERCRFSNVGHDSVDLAAPGVDVLSTVPGGYAVFDGTSMAAPHVAGAAGLVRSLHPEYTVLELRNAILNSVDLPATLGEGLTRTGGRLNAARALDAATSTTQPPSVGNIATATRMRNVVSGLLSEPGNVNDVFRKTLRSGSRYRVALEVPRGQDFDLFVWKPGTLEIFQLDASCLTGGRCRSLAGVGGLGTGEDELVEFRATKAGTYYFQVASFFSSGRYRLVVDRI